MNEPNIEQYIYFAMMITETLMENIEENLAGTRFDDTKQREVIQTIRTGMRLSQIRMLEIFKKLPDQKSVCH